ncbi:hypothetical protein PIB30_085908, partial [Stylosanthes scabra]|nr:hypothetical protein [Stylosanthes scabra]
MDDQEKGGEEGSAELEIGAGGGDGTLPLSLSIITLFAQIGDEAAVTPCSFLAQENDVELKRVMSNRATTRYRAPAILPIFAENQFNASNVFIMEEHAHGCMPPSIMHSKSTTRQASRERKLQTPPPSDDPCDAASTHFRGLDYKHKHTQTETDIESQTQTEADGA